MTDTSNLTQLISALRAETESASISPENLGYILQSIVDFLPNLDDSGMAGDIASAKANAATALTRAAEALTSANNATAVAAGAQTVANAAQASAAQSQTASQAATAAVAALTALVQTLNGALADKASKTQLAAVDQKIEAEITGRNTADESMQQLILLNRAEIKKKAELNDMGVLASGQEQRLVLLFVNIDGKRVEINIPGVYYNGSTKKIETYKQQGEGMMSIVQRVFSEEPSQNVVYCDKGTNTLHRWNGTEMVPVSGNTFVMVDKPFDRKNHVYNTGNNKTIRLPAQTVATQSSVVHCMAVALDGVKKVNIRTSGLNPFSLPYYFVDKNNNVVEMGGESTNLNQTINVPEGAVRLYVNYTYASYPVDDPGVTLYYDRNDYVLNHIKNDKPLAGKKVVMLGDSIHEFTEQGIGIVEHFAEMSGATVYRCAVGGGHLSKRAAMGYDVPHVVDALTSAEGLAQLEQVLTTEFGGAKKYIYDIVASVDIMDVDIVTVMAGTNDWASANPAVGLGNDNDTTEVNNISGAVKYIIDTLLAVNPRLKIVFFTPIPRAYNADLANFSDTYIPSTGGYLLPDLCERVMAVCKQQHTPCCDLYWGMGWNKTNLLAFAGGDGVHPMQGFREMAEKELAFILSKG